MSHPQEKRQQSLSPIKLVKHFPKTHLAAAGALLVGLFLLEGLTSPDAQGIAHQTQQELAIPEDTQVDDESFAKVQPQPTDVLKAQPETIEPQASEADAIASTPEPVIEPEAPWQTVTVKSGDSLAQIFSRAGLSATTLYKLMHSDDQAQVLKKIHPGQEIRFQVDNDNNLLTLTYHPNRRETLIAKAEEDGFTVDVEEKPIEKRIQYANGTIDSALFFAAKEAGLSDNMTMKLANIFGWDIDFVLDIRKGDSFELMYEEHYVDGEKIRDGEILAANFTNRGETFTAIYYTDASGRSDYYNPEGNSVRKAFLRTPVDFTRISSRFNPNRLHPIFKTKRPHTGVDYAAPRGTPIKAAGDGKVTVARRKGGYGYAVVIQHGQSYSTLYGHLSRFGRGVKEGRRVKQGQIIGYVGATGWATGPHLHYEFRINGVHRNPLTVKLPDGDPIKSSYREDFLAHAATLRGQLAMYSKEAQTTLAQNSAE